MTASQTILVGIYEHARFANARLLDQAMLLTEEELDREWPGMSDSILRSLFHMFGGQQSWMERIGAVEPAERWPADLPALRADWDALDTRTLDYIATLTDIQMLERIRMTNPGYWDIEAPRWEALIHQAFHQHQYRGEIAAMLTALGRSPGELDPFEYFEIDGSAIDVSSNVMSDLTES